MQRTLYLHSQFESTSQHAAMPLSDMADLHVSQHPEGAGALRTVMFWSSQCRREANLALSSAGEVALQRNCSISDGETRQAAEDWITRLHYIKTRKLETWSSYAHVKPDSTAPDSCLHRHHRFWSFLALKGSYCCIYLVRLAFTALLWEFYSFLKELCSLSFYFHKRYKKNKIWKVFILFGFRIIIK